MQNLLRSLPKVDDVLNNGDIKLYIDKLGREPVVDIIRQVLEGVRNDVLSKKVADDALGVALARIKTSLRDLERFSLQRVLNGTGVILHTNLGRAKLSKEAIDRVITVASNYSNLEYDLDKAGRGSRYSHVEDLLKKITNAEDALVVNNNAAAVLLALNTLAKGGEAIVSRGQLIEIGGSFRIPDVMEQSGCKLKEVGTTNKTHIEDYETAINEHTTALLKVHTSNYKILGFTKEVTTEEMAVLGKKYNLPVIEDLGSGMIINPKKLGLSYEPTVAEVIAQGADVVTFSGDKLLGGPQAGIIVGKKEYVSKMKSNHLNRALRIDKMTLAALEATLKQYLDEERAFQTIPIIKMLAMTKDELSDRADVILAKLIGELEDRAQLKKVSLSGQVGGGALPLDRTDSCGISIVPKELSVSEYETKLRMADLPLIGRVEDNQFLVDLRTIDETEEELLIKSLVAPLLGD
jgi:L-seryl-tRNA(Ser) seleniumtransferase